MCLCLSETALSHLFVRPAASAAFLAQWTCFNNEGTLCLLQLAASPSCSTGHKLPKCVKPEQYFPSSFHPKALKLSESSQMGGQIHRQEPFKRPQFRLTVATRAVIGIAFEFTEDRLACRALGSARLGSAARLTSQHAALAAVTAAVPRRTPSSLALILAPFPFLSEIMCGMPFHPSPSPSCHLAVRTTQRRSGSQTGFLCSLLLCHAADKTSIHISLKERKDLRDFHLLSFSFFLGFPLFIHLPPPFCISHSVPPSVQSVVYILRRQFAS